MRDRLWPRALLPHAPLTLPLPLPRRRPVPPPGLAVRCLGLDFDSPIGLAAGFDKGDVSVAGLFALGFSHVEIGTITPRPQPGNDRPRIFRLPEHRALINRMGFNNEGAEVCAERLAALPREARLGPVGVNVGKKSDAIIRAVSGMGQTLGMAIVAEGLETIEQVEAVREAGCTLGQGYYFSRAVPDYVAAMLLSQERDSRKPERLAS